jgi:hypothetical protein
MLWSETVRQQLSDRRLPHTSLRDAAFKDVCILHVNHPDISFLITRVVNVNRVPEPVVNSQKGRGKLAFPASKIL